MTVSKSGNGAGVVTSAPAGINCGADCDENYTAGTVVTLTATATGGSSFVDWQGACTGANPVCQVTMDAAQATTATFVLANTYPLTVSKSGNGTGVVTSAPAGIDCGADCDESYHGTVVTLTATATGGSSFVNWQGACTGANPVCQVTMDAAQATTATFVLDTYPLTVSKSGNGAGVVTSAPLGSTAAPTVTRPIGRHGGHAHGRGDRRLQLRGLARRLHRRQSSLPGHHGRGASDDRHLRIAAPDTYPLTVAKSGNGSGVVASVPAGIDCGADCTEELRRRHGGHADGRGNRRLQLRELARRLHGRQSGLPGHHGRGASDDSYLRHRRANTYPLTVAKARHRQWRGRQRPRLGSTAALTARRATSMARWSR